LLFVFSALFHGPCAAPNPPQLIQHRAADAHARVGLKRISIAGIVIAQCLEQSDQSRALQIVVVHVFGQSHGQPAKDDTHQGKVLLDKIVLGMSIGLLMIAFPELLCGAPRFNLGGLLL
jgi:hypothetical protein